MEKSQAPSVKKESLKEKTDQNSKLFTNNDLVEKGKKEGNGLKNTPFQTGKMVVLCATMFAATMFAGCNSSNHKVDTSRDNVTKAEEALKKAQEEHRAEVDKYRAETNLIIAANEKSIADFNARMKQNNNQPNREYEVQVSDLEQRNRNLKRKLNEYKADTKDTWRSFKTDFNNEMNELGRALKSLTSDERR